MKKISPESLEKAQGVYDLLVRVLKKGDWKFEGNDEELYVMSAYVGEDYPISFFIRVDAHRECLIFATGDIAVFEEEKRAEGALAVCAANHGALFGHFDYDASKGTVRYLLTASFAGCSLQEKFIVDFLESGLVMCDRFNERFLALAQGDTCLKKFTESVLD